MTRLLSTAVTVIAFAAVPAGAQQADPVRYIVCIPAPATHYPEVEATCPTSGKPAIGRHWLSSFEGLCHD